MTSKAFGLAQLGNAYADGALSNRNKIINGAMTIDQRNAGAAVTDVSGSGSFSVDRWRTMLGGYGTGRVSLQQVSDAPSGFAYSVKTTVTTAVTIPSTGVLTLAQGVEGFNVADLDWGTSNALPVTVSFWAKASLAGTYGLTILNGSENRSYRTHFELAASTWEYKTVTIPGDITGSWPDDSSNAMRVAFIMDAGSSFFGAVGAWEASANYGASGQTPMFSTLGATFQFTGVQLEAGDTATPFEHRSYGQELALCQRYCQVFRSTDGEYDYFASGAFYNSTQGRFYKPLLVPMRTAPTFSSTTVGSFYVDAVSYIALSSLSLESAEKESVRLGFTASSAGSNSTGYGAFLASSTSSTETLSFFAEL